MLAAIVVAILRYSFLTWRQWPARQMERLEYLRQKDER